MLYIVFRVIMGFITLFLMFNAFIALYFLLTKIIVKNSNNGIKYKFQKTLLLIYYYCFILVLDTHWNVGTEICVQIPFFIYFILFYVHGHNEYIEIIFNVCIMKKRKNYDKNKFPPGEK